MKVLKFEFVQHGEFASPEYYITDEEDGEYLGFIYYNGGWLFYSSGSNWGLSSYELRQIARMTDALNASTRSQRILGVF